MAGEWISTSLVTIAAGMTLLLSHIVRAIRWQMLFPPKAMPDRFSLLIALSIGYIVNAVVPWRLGEIARVYFVTRRTGVRFSLVGASVIVERVSDLSATAIFFGCFVIANQATADEFGASIALFVSAGLALLTFLLALRLSGGTRRLLWLVTSVLSDRVRLSLLDLCWSASEILIARVLLDRRFLVLTIVMWAGYATSYALLGHAIGASSSDVAFGLLTAPLEPQIAKSGASGRVAAALLLFATVPVVFVLAYGLTRQWEPISAALHLGSTRNRRPHRSLVVSVHDRFMRSAEYDSFLTSLFSGERHAVASFGLRSIDDGVVHRFYPGGSGAVTALFERDGRLLVRKFASGPAADKLNAQVAWLLDNGLHAIPLVEVVERAERAQYVSYDMKAVPSAIDFYDFIHIAPIDESTKILQDVASTMARFHQQTSSGLADPAIIDDYLEQKVIRNAIQIRRFAEGFLPASAFTINQKPHSLTEWKRLEDITWLRTQLARHDVANIHGDLTIENIIVAPEHPPGWYLIDPNPDNIFNSPLIDWAKLMQSLHLGYEGLNRSSRCAFDGGRISIPFTRSKPYAELHNLLLGELEANFGAAGMREVYFHEIVNYLRLTPYKISTDPEKGLMFFACAVVLLDRYLERHG